MSAEAIRRRRFVQGGLCALVAGSGIASLLLRGPASAAEAPRLLPPGARDDGSFHAACVRCGLCVQACPYGTLRLAGFDGTARIGTPYFVARETPCEMCVDLPCVRACPTGALDPALDDVRDARMGTASLSRPESCNSHAGAGFCNSCWLACPLRDEALVMVYGATKRGGFFTPVVNSDECTGCGKCEQACIAPSAAITVAPRDA